MVGGSISSWSIIPLNLFIFCKRDKTLKCTKRLEISSTLILILLQRRHLRYLNKFTNTLYHIWMGSTQFNKLSSIAWLPIWTWLYTTRTSSNFKKSYFSSSRFVITYPKTKQKLSIEALLSLIKRTLRYLAYTDWSLQPILIFIIFPYLRMVDTS